MALLTAEQILAAQDLPTKDVYIKEWGGTVRVASITAEDAENARLAADKGGDILSEMLSRCAVDEAGNRLFSVEQAKQLKKKSNRAFMKFGMAALELNGMTEEAQKDIAGNSKAPADGDGSSA